MVALSRLLDAFKQLGKPIHITEMGANGGVRSLTQAGGGKQLVPAEYVRGDLA